jgi:hypothetical protein
MLSSPLRALRKAARALLERDRAHLNTTNTQKEWNYALRPTHSSLVFKQKCDLKRCKKQAFLERKIEFHKFQHVSKIQSPSGE